MLCKVNSDGSPFMVRSFGRLRTYHERLSSNTVHPEPFDLAQGRLVEG